MVAAIGRGGENIDAAGALDHVYGYAVGLDMTRRDLQAVAKQLSRPWDFAKGFDQSCPISPIVPAASIGHPCSGTISLKVNGEPRQSGDLSQMIWGVSDAIACLSRFVSLAPGDLLMMGTPAGVGNVNPGDTLSGSCENVGTIEVHYASRPH